MLKESRVTVKIPRPLYRRIQQVIENSGFSSPTDFIVYVLRDLLGEVEAVQDARQARSVVEKADVVEQAASQVEREEFSPEELRAIKRKLKNLGYLD